MKPGLLVWQCILCAAFILVFSFPLETADAGTFPEFQRTRTVLPLSIAKDLPSYTVTWTDVNKDGFPDLYLNHHADGPPTLLLSRTNPLRLVDTVPPQVMKRDRHSAVWADYDGDGEPELLQTTGAGHGLSLFPAKTSNELFEFKLGRLVPADYNHGLAYPLSRSRQPVPFDFSGDGRLDVFNGSLIRLDGQAPTTVFVGTASGKYQSETNFFGFDITEFAAMRYGRFRKGNEVQFMAKNVETIILVRRNSEFEPKRILLSSNVKIFDLIVADFNNDGISDVWVAAGLWDRQSNNRDTILFGSELGQFSAVLPRVERDFQNVAAGDFDNDGDIDVYAALTGASGNLGHLFYINDGKGHFTPSPKLPDAPLGYSQTVSVVDYNRDGWLDIFSANGHDKRVGPYELFRNQGGTNGWVLLDVSAAEGDPAVLGSIIEIKTGQGSQMRVYDAGLRLQGQDDPIVHFGLGNATLVAELKVSWTNGGSNSVRELPGKQKFLLWRGTSGPDSRTGTERNELMFGGGGDDRLRGAAGNDILDGGAGNDFYAGGPGADRFVLLRGRDVVLDFQQGFDKIDVSGWRDPVTNEKLTFSDLLLKQVNTSVHVFVDEDHNGIADLSDTLIVRNSSLDQFEDSDFVW